MLNNFKLGILSNFDPNKLELNLINMETLLADFKIWPSIKKISCKFYAGKPFSWPEEFFSYNQFRIFHGNNKNTKN